MLRQEEYLKPPDNVGSGTKKTSRRQESIIGTAELMKLSKARAQNIFLSMIEKAVTPIYFVQQARYIDPAIYDDIVTERALTGLCGYPLCSRQFTDQFGKRTYIIRNNKVYDISERRNFCSAVCYEASEIVRKQLARDPLYLRYDENKFITDVKIPKMKRLQGLSGKFIDVTGGLQTLEEEMKSFTSVSQLAEETLVTCSENTVIDDESKLEGKSENQSESKLESNPESKSERKLQSKSESKPGSKLESNPESKPESRQESKPENKSESRQESKPESRSECKPGRKPQSHKNEKGHINKDRQEAGIDINGNMEAKLEPLSSVHEVEMALREWMSFDSLREVLGDQYVRGMLEHIGRNWENYDTALGLSLGVEAKAKYITICRKLDYEERMCEAELLRTECVVADYKPKCPLPDYQQLQKDAKQLQMKVVSFLGGSDQYEQEEEAAAHKKNKKGKVKKTDEQDDSHVVLPFIDNYSQLSWRQYIVEEKIKAYLQQIISVTYLNGLEVHRLLKALIATFDLTPKNISFKPKQWRLITIILLKMLTVRYPVILEALKSTDAVNIQKMVLSTFGLDLDYCDRILSYLTEINYIMCKNLKKEGSIQIQQDELYPNNGIIIQGECNVDKADSHDTSTSNAPSQGKHSLDQVPITTANQAVCSLNQVSTLETNTDFESAAQQDHEDVSSSKQENLSNNHQVTLESFNFKENCTDAEELD